LFCSNGQWFFTTREGAQGPYGQKEQAEMALRRFIGEKVDLKEFQDSRDAEILDMDRLTTIVNRVDEDGDSVELRKFENDADLLL
jgi:hypothetical protein